MRSVCSLWSKNKALSVHLCLQHDGRYAARARFVCNSHSRYLLSGGQRWDCCDVIMSVCLTYYNKAGVCVVSVYRRHDGATSGLLWGQRRRCTVADSLWSRREHCWRSRTHSSALGLYCQLHSLSAGVTSAWGALCSRLKVHSHRIRCQRTFSLPHRTEHKRLHYCRQILCPCTAQLYKQLHL